MGKSHDMDMDITWTECKMWLSIGQMCGMVKKNIDIDLKVLFEDNSDTSKYLFMADWRNVHINKVLDNQKGAFLTHVVNFEANGPNQLWHGNIMGKVLLGRQLRSLGHRGLRYDFLKRKQRKNCECCPVSKLIVKFSIVRILISVSNVTSLQDCLFNCKNC